MQTVAIIMVGSYLVILILSCLVQNCHCNHDENEGLTDIPLKPPTGQRCRGRTETGQRCCTPEDPCGEGEGDCDGPYDGASVHDSHKGCMDGLLCGSNNCRKFGLYYHEEDDCCEKPPLTLSELDTDECRRVQPFGILCVPQIPEPNQRCAGRNNGSIKGQRCCTPDNPCEEGEGDCDGPLDGSVDGPLYPQASHDDHKGCKGDLVCGSNNCKKFGFFYHEDDDCCEKP